MYNNSKIYVNIPSQVMAGGVESLFQLVDAINNLGGRAYVIWDRPCSNPVPDKYLHYNIIESTQVEDEKSNMIIYPEIWTDKLNFYSNIKKAIWWLSVDNNKNNFKEFSNENITHFCQSLYSLHYLHQNKAKNYLYLNDYISEKYSNSNYNINEKQNIVCYNPEKGIDVTNQIISLNSHINFIPITRMSENEIINLLRVSKIYIDFGNHPGKDRIPREAAALGNCIITGDKGAASFYSDIPIENKYKISNLEKINDIILDCFKNYETNLYNFKLYRSIIKNEKTQLFNLVRAYFL